MIYIYIVRSCVWVHNFEDIPISHVPKLAASLHLTPPPAKAATMKSLVRPVHVYLPIMYPIGRYLARASTVEDSW